MHHSTIFTKTAKGLGEALGKTKALGRDLRKILKEVNGKATFAELRERLDDMAEAKLQEALAKLLEGDYIREFATAPTTGGDTGFGLTHLPALDKADSQLTIGDFLREVAAAPPAGGDLNFKSLAQADEMDEVEAGQKALIDEMLREEQAARVKQEALAKAQVEAKARAEAERRVKADVESKLKRETEERAKKEAAEKIRLEAEHQARLKAETNARRAAEERVRHEAEARTRKEAEETARKEAQENARRAAEEQARKQAEERARLEAEAKAKREAEELARKKAEEEARRAAEEKTRLEAEARAKREAEERARKDAEERARKEAEEQARLEAEAEAKREAEEKARQEAEAKARRDAEERARKEAEEQARIEAEARARRDAEERARQEQERVRHEAEERARKEVEEQARIEAEARARRDAEKRARLMAEEEARNAAVEKAREEAEEKARQEAEAQAQREAEAQAIRDAEAKREAEAQAKRDAEARREAEAQAMRDAEARREAEAQAAEEMARQEAEDKVRREAETLARKEAEEQVRRESEERARQEAEQRARLDAEEKAKREAEEKVRQDALEQARREAEEKARLVAAEKALLVAEANAKKQAEEEAKRTAKEQARRDKEEQARLKAADKARQKAEREAEKEARSAAEAAQRIAAAGADRPLRKPFGLKQMLRLGAIAIVLSIFSGLVMLHVVSFDNRISTLQQTASAQIGHPVTIRKLRFSLFPKPHWRLLGIAIGNGAQISAPEVLAYGPVSDLMDERLHFDTMQVHSPVLTDEGLGWLLLGKTGTAGFNLGHITASNVRLLLSDVRLPIFHADLELRQGGVLKAIGLEAEGGRMQITLRPQGDTVQVEIKGDAVLPTLGAALPLQGFSASGVATRSELNLTQISAYAYDGSVSGSASLAWGSTWSLNGELRATLPDGGKFLPQLLQGGRLEGNMKFMMQSKDAGKLFAAPRASGVFTALNGNLLGVDFGDLLRGASGIGGKFPFSKASGTYVLDGGNLQVRRISLAAGALSAVASADVAAAGKINGQISAELKTPGRQGRSATLALSGTVNEPKFSQP